MFAESYLYLHAGIRWFICARVSGLRKKGASEHDSYDYRINRIKTVQNKFVYRHDVSAPILNHLKTPDLISRFNSLRSKHFLYKHFCHNVRICCFIASDFPDIQINLEVIHHFCKFLIISCRKIMFLTLICKTQSY